jgi:Tfp pilus assembly protein PilF
MEPFDRERMLDEAGEALAAGQHVRALALLDQLVAMDPGDPAARRVRAQALLQSGAGDEALSEARRAVELAPLDDHAQRVLGWAAWQAGRLDLAQAAWETVVRVSDRSPPSLAEYAEFLACARGPRLGERAARKAIRADATSATAWAALGIAQYRMRRRQKAEASLRHALALDADNPRAQWGMILLLRDRGDYARADELAAALRAYPGAEGFAREVHQEAADRALVARLRLQRQDAGAAFAVGADGAERLRGWIALGGVLLGVAGLAAVWVPRYGVWIGIALLVACGLSVRAWYLMR